MKRFVLPSAVPFSDWEARDIDANGPVERRSLLASAPRSRTGWNHGFLEVVGGQ